MEFRPHTFRFLIKAQGHDDENGNFVIDKEGSLSKPIPCRWIPNGSGRTLSLPDENGGVQVYSYTILFDSICCCKEFKYGDIIVWMDNCQEKESKKVLKFHRYQNYCKIWV